MKTMRKVIAILLLMSIALLPVAGLGEAGFEFLKLLMEKPLSDDVTVPLATGKSITSDVKEDTSHGVLCTIMFSDEGNTIMISGINDGGKYEIVLYSDLSMVQMLYYSYLVSKAYSEIQSMMPSGEIYSILVSYGDDVVFINDASKAEQFAQTIMDTVKELANQ